MAFAFDSPQGRVPESGAVLEEWVSAGGDLESVVSGYNPCRDAHSVANYLFSKIGRVPVGWTRVQQRSIALDILSVMVKRQIISDERCEEIGRALPG